MVLRVHHDGRDVVVKAGGAGNHHLRREIHARRRWTGPWLATGSVGALLHACTEAGVLVVEHLPGRLVQDVPEAAGDPATYRQAGRLLASFHAQHRERDVGHEAAADAKVRWWLEQEHRIPAPAVAGVHEALASHAHDVVDLVPTHGDWHTRNWLVHEGEVRVIDLGRAELRPAWTDLVRLAGREWVGRPDLEEAFLDGYGSDPRPRGLWRATLLREAVGTAVWAYRVGDHAFEEHGLRLLEEALERYR
ncbi:hypothetical protein GCM10011509_20640 [Ornithinimicrobium pekingense]|uniref:Aminoglycoside phosphotransferase domain-containing protein n=1 Tax=Ornithinimicrobium pekingense TaxID=384677 RepID=A0ABQ2F8D8_9MICO|nr:hypothetical protein GCM10011509_20640 [Ornithinimicrobium pekingense]